MALLSGALLVFAYAPFQQAWIVIPVLVILLWLARNSSPRRAWQIGYLFGVGWFSTGLSWIYVSIDTFGGLPIVATVAILAVLFMYLSLFPALALWAWRAAAIRHWPSAIWLVPLCWYGAEWLRGTLFTGFPWLELGYTQTDSYLGQYATWIGGTGVTVILWYAAVSIFEYLRTNQLRYAVSTISILVVPFGLFWLQPIERTEQTVNVLLVQGNIAQSSKWNPDQHWPSLMTYLDLSRPHYADHDIIIWPESAVTMPEPYTDDVLGNIHSALVKSNTALITGILDYRDFDYYNSLIVLGSDGTQGVEEPYYHGHSNRYEKHQLLPIGEFVPFEDILRPLAPLFDLPMSSFSRGNYQQSNLRAKGFELSAAICYEIAFPRQVRANLTANTDFLLTVSNDTWFGASHGPAQHMQIARMRALELGRPLLRATNNGISAIVAENGQEIARAPQFEEATVSAEVPVVKGVTLYAQWGEWLAAWIAACGVIIGIVSIVKRRQNQ
ncbi:MAG TPA: apolipoprotein N-acyltransferase [Pseudidiomarina sp.]|nr:apolipoprotein N-acyltransferase [Pseudidiomarina sp.]